MTDCTHDCSTCGVECASRQQESLLVAPNAHSHIAKVVAVCSGKGGVGKSMVTALLAVLARRMGQRVGILDADITGPSIPKAFGLTAKATGSEGGIVPVASKTGIDIISLNLLLENDTDPVVWRGPVIAGAVQQFWTDVMWGGKDLLFIDLPPGTGDVMLTVLQSLPVDAIVEVTTPQQLVGMVVEKAIKMAEMMQIPVLGLVENMGYITCPDCSRIIEPFGPSRLEETAARYGIPHSAQLPMDPALASQVDQGVVELFEGTWLDSLAQALVDMQPKAKDGTPLQE